MKIFLAAPWAHRELANHAADKLRLAGFAVTSRWLTAEETDEPAELIQQALNDAEDIIASDIVVVLNTQERGKETSGKAVETGIALGIGRPVIIVGARTNIYHYLVECVLTVEDVISRLMVAQDAMEVINKNKNGKES